MSILVDKNTKLIVQGMTGREGSFHTEQMLKYGTSVVAGVTPGKGGQEILGIKVYDKVAEAVKATGANTTVIFVPAPFCKAAVIEACDAGIKLIVVITEGIPIQDMVEATQYAQKAQARIIGPNCPGLTSVDKTKIGIIPGHIFKKGTIGIISRSGTLTYEVIAEITRAGLGQTTCIGVGGDMIIGTRFIDLLPLFESDPETEAIVLIGEIGGNDEEEAAAYIATHMKKPVIAFISGKSAPSGKRMGHAGAIISGTMGTAKSKVEAFNKAKVIVAESTSDIPGLLIQQLHLTKKK